MGGRFIQILTQHAGRQRVFGGHGHKYKTALYFCQGTFIMEVFARLKEQENYGSVHFSGLLTAWASSVFLWEFQNF